MLMIDRDYPYCHAYRFMQTNAAPGKLLCKTQVAADLRAFAEAQGISEHELACALADRYLMRGAF